MLPAMPSPRPDLEDAVDANATATLLLRDQISELRTDVGRLCLEVRLVADRVAEVRGAVVGATGRILGQLSTLLRGLSATQMAALGMLVTTVTVAFAMALPLTAAGIVLAWRHPEAVLNVIATVLRAPPAAAP